MISAAPRAVMTLAACCLEGSRRNWARAMEAEFEAAECDGRQWSFSLGCLLAAWRGLPTHVEGRLLLARYAVGLLLIVPIAALLLSATFLRLPEIGFLIAAFDPGQTRSAELVNVGNRAAAPVLTQLGFAIGVLRLGSAWALLERDWARVAALERLSVAATIALAVLAGLATLDAARAILPATTLVVEIAALCALARLHARVPLGCNA